MVYYINGAKEFKEIFIQSSLILNILGLFDGLFVDKYWVQHTKAWFIPGTEDLMPYIPKQNEIVRWIGTIVGFTIMGLIIALVMSMII